MKNCTNSIARFYHNLLSVDWEERLEAYSVIERDLKLRGCCQLNEERWEDMKLLAGQIISIHFKRYVPKDLEDFKEKLSQLYGRLLGALRKDTSEGYRDSAQLLVDIYDDDDDVARRDIRDYFSGQDKGGFDVSRTVLENLFRCYEDMMKRVSARFCMGN